MDNLPDEIILKILHLLDFDTQQECALACKKLHRLSWDLTFAKTIRITPSRFLSDDLKTNKFMNFAPATSDFPISRGEKIPESSECSTSQSSSPFLRATWSYPENVTGLIIQDIVPTPDEAEILCSTFPNISRLYCQGWALKGNTKPGWWERGYSIWEKSHQIISTPKTKPPSPSPIKSSSPIKPSSPIASSSSSKAKATLKTKKKTKNRRPARPKKSKGEIQKEQNQDEMSKGIMRQILDFALSFQPAKLKVLTLSGWTTHRYMRNERYLDCPSSKLWDILNRYPNLTQLEIPMNIPPTTPGDTIPLFPSLTYLRLFQNTSFQVFSSIKYPFGSVFPNLEKLSFGDRDPFPDPITFENTPKLSKLQTVLPHAKNNSSSFMTLRILPYYPHQTHFFSKLNQLPEPAILTKIFTDSSVPSGCFTDLTLQNSNSIVSHIPKLQHLFSSSPFSRLAKCQFENFYCDNFGALWKILASNCADTLKELIFGNSYKPLETNALQNHIRNIVPLPPDQDPRSNSNSTASPKIPKDFADHPFYPIEKIVLVNHTHKNCGLDERLSVNPGDYIRILSTGNHASSNSKFPSWQGWSYAERVKGPLEPTQMFDYQDFLVYTNFDRGMISNSSFTDLDWYQLLFGTPEPVFPRFRSFEIYTSKINKDNCLDMARLLPPLENLSLKGADKLTDDDLEPLLKRCGTFLIHLNLFRCKNLTGKTVLNIAKYNTSIQTLNIDEVKYTWNDIHCSIPKLKRLKKLWLTRNEDTVEMDKLWKIPSIQLIDCWWHFYGSLQRKDISHRPLLR